QERRQAALAANRVAIESRHARGRTRASDLGFDPLGPEPGLFEVRACAQRTCGGHAGGVVAVMAARTPRRSLAVHDERDAAIRTLHRAGALTAENGGGEAAPVQQHDRLLVPFES